MQNTFYTYILDKLLLNTFFREKKLKKILYFLNINLMNQVQTKHFLQDIFQMTAIALVSVINHYHINTLHLF